MGYSGPKYLQTQTLPGPDLPRTLGWAVPGPKCSFVSVPGYAVFPSPKVPSGFLIWNKGESFHNAAFTLN